MPLEAGARLGPYEIVNRAGAGGMGEVYRARDARFDRTVAIKVLPPDLTGDPAARQRFEREARAVAALSHPHICTLHDIGHQNGTDFLVMEFLDGETLAQRLTHGRLPLDQALHYALQIADALAAAHKAAILHRDLKPGNIMLTKSGAKLLDFGLAKPGVQIAGAGFTQLATQAPLTGAGTLLGTLHYMSPEQLQGRPADARADVFAFGCVLYEMIAGRRAFPGGTPASTIAAVLEREPAPVVASADQVAPPALDAIIRICLAKNAEERWSSGHDLLLALRRFGQAGDVPSAVVASKSGSRRATVPWVIAGLLLASTIAALYRSSGRPVVPLAAPAMQASIEFPKAALGFPLLSSDGRYLALSALGESRILVRRLADGEALRLAGAEQGMPLAWSPDSRSLAFLAEREIKAVDIVTGGIRTIGRAPERVFGRGAWSGDDLLLAGPHLRRMSIGDGHIRDVYPPDADVAHQGSPTFLPDGRTFLFSQQSRNPARRGVFFGTLDSSAVTRLLRDPASVAVSARGYLVYGSKGTLFAQRFDLEHHRVAGDPVSVASGLWTHGEYTEFAITGDTLLWARAWLAPARLMWFDRNGRKLNEVGDVRPYFQIALAPDGQRVVTEETVSNGGLFVSELGRPIHARLTRGEDRETDPIWSPDGREVAFNCDVGVCTRGIDQTERTTFLVSALTGVEDWTHDGRFIILQFTETSASAVPLTGERKPIPVLESSSHVDEPHVSRDGRWLAYSADDTGQWEVYVQPFMRPGGRVRVSTNGGSQARWRADGRELFYLALDGTMMSVDVSNALMPAAPRKLFESRLVVSAVADQYDVTADGQRFLLIVPEGEFATRLTVLTNWPSVLNGR